MADLYSHVSSSTAVHRLNAEFPADNHFDLTPTTLDFENLFPQMRQSSPNAQQASNAHLQGPISSPEHVEDDPDDRTTGRGEMAILADGNEAIIAEGRPD
jgi:hypothetical protein